MAKISSSISTTGDTARSEAVSHNRKDFEAVVTAIKDEEPTELKIDGFPSMPGGQHPTQNEELVMN
jgi:negative regulator of sigma E activity